MPHLPQQTNGLINNFGVRFCNFWVKILKTYFRFIQDVRMKLRKLNFSSKSSSPSPAMFSVLSSAQLLSFLLAALGPGRLLQYCINIRGIGLNQYSRYWIASIFEELDCINISGIGLNQYSRYWIESWKLKDWIEPKILFAIGLTAFLYLLKD